jgi:uncharacterized protein (DUF4415 family)
MNNTKMTKKQEREIAALLALRERDIDLSDQDEVKDWTDGIVGKFYRPIKKPVTVRLDADVLAWLKAQGKGYQTRINSLLRAAMSSQGRKRRA